MLGSNEKVDFKRVAVFGLLLGGCYFSPLKHVNMTYVLPWVAPNVAEASLFSVAGRKILFDQLVFVPSSLAGFFMFANIS